MEVLMQTQQIKKRQRKLKGYRLESELSDHISFEASKLGISDNDYVRGIFAKDAKAKGKKLKYDYWH
tara:strand:- start:1708 stop:1908 length:201 start_codon:yes stop_codon:yes gene_type:complete